MGDPRSFPADEEGWEQLLADQRREAGAEPADRHARLARGHAHLTMTTHRSPPVRSRCGCYPHNDLDRGGDRRRAARAGRARRSEHGFDGVMTSEHHGGFHGYLPNPLQVAGCCLEAMADGWAAPCPLLLPLRPPALVAEEIAWLAARFPGRVGLGVAVGRAARRLRDHARADGRPHRRVSPTGSRSWPGCSTAPTRGSSPTIRRSRACRRAADPGAERGDGLHRGAPRRAPRRGHPLRLARRRPSGAASSSTRTARRAARGPCVLIRRAWVGEPPRRAARRPGRRVPQLLQRTRPSSTGSGDEMRRRADAGARGRRAGRRPCTAPGPTRCNLRVHVPGRHPAAGARADRPAGRRGAARPARASRRRATRDVMSRRIYRFEDAEWHVPDRARAPIPRRRPPPAELGAARRFLAQGDGGFYTQVVRMPPGFEAPRAQPRPHRGVHGARGRLRRSTASRWTRFDLDRGRGRTSRTGSSPVPTVSRSSSSARARPSFAPHESGS